MKTNEVKQPNIIFILIDDLGWKDLSCYGSKFYETPHLDKLYKEGMSFTDAYAACPVCSPTRASILTGKYPANVGVTNYIDYTGHPAKGRLVDAPYIKQLPLSEVALSKALKTGGYETWHVGKWHLGKAPYYPEHHGFDINIGGCHNGMPKSGYFSPWNIENLEDKEEGQYLTDRLTDEAIDLIKKNEDKPYFLNLCYYSVHTPIQAKEAYIDKFEKKAKDMGIDKIEPFEEGDAFPCDHKKHMRIKRRLVQSDATYAAMIYSLDENIGRLLEAVKEAGQEKDTVVFFTSDNGGLATAEGSPTCNAPLNEGKGWMSEGGVREPLIVKWPGKIEANSSCQTPVTSPDFYPTILEMAGMDLMPEQHEDGESIMPLLTQSGEIEREAIFWHYPHYGNQGGTPGSSIRMGDYKLIEFFEDGRLELFNLRKDISEKENLVTREPDKCTEMYNRLKKWQQDIEAKFPVINDGYKSPC